MFGVAAAYTQIIILLTLSMSVHQFLFFVPDMHIVLVLILKSICNNLYMFLLFSRKYLVFVSVSCNCSSMR